ncbi:MAG: 3-methyl-2-oxobutanoate hydroxymethyltransferase [Spirochaetia bacterium]|nr:3-methyl-2-oxobutanoate hydroxymethyltransferase [Spirochaetia bacterium]
MNETPLKYPADWTNRKRMSKRITMITAYDHTMARLIDRTSVDSILVGDSLGMVVQGKGSTLPVTLDEIIYHASMVRRGTSKFLVADLPFGSYQVSDEQAVAAAVRLMKECGADAVKLEGAQDFALEVIRHLTSIGVPVMGHLGFLPQSVHTLGGYSKQGKVFPEELVEQARALEQAGCFAMVLELVMEDVAAQMTKAVKIPTIGIASGSQTDGQVQVLHDVLGLDPDFRPRHAMRKRDLAPEILGALNDFHSSVTG